MSYGIHFRGLSERLIYRNKGLVTVCRYLDVQGVVRGCFACMWQVRSRDTDVINGYIVYGPPAKHRIPTTLSMHACLSAQVHVRISRECRFPFLPILCLVDRPTMLASLCFNIIYVYYRLNAPLNAAVPEGGGGALGGPCLGDGAGGAAWLGGPADGAAAATGLTVLATSAMFGICVSIRSWKTF